MYKTIHDIENIPFFFILGRPRSGTTLLSVLLDAHQNIVVPFECSLIINLQSKYGNITKWDQNKLNSFYHDLLLQRKFSGWPMDHEKLKRSLLKCDEKVTYPDLIKIVYLHFNSYFEKGNINIIGDKNPVYSFYGKQLLKLFPKAKVIHLVRDYRDNILSIKKVNFEAPVTSLLAHRWKLANKQILQLKEKYPKQYFPLKYEDLVNTPEIQIKNLCEFLDVPYQNDILDFYSIKDKVYEKYSKEEVDKYHKSLYQPINKNKIGNWQKEMKNKDIKIADSIAQPFGNQFEYKPKHSKSYFRKILSLPWISYSYFSLLNRKLIDLLPFFIKNKIRNQGPVLAFIFNKIIKQK